MRSLQSHHMDAKKIVFLTDLLHFFSLGIESV